MTTPHARLEALVEANDNNKATTARLLGWTRRQVQSRLARPHTAAKYAAAIESAWAAFDARESKPPSPLHEQGALAYKARSIGCTWREAASRGGFSSAFSALRGARRYAEQAGEPWPVPPTA